MNRTAVVAGATGLTGGALLDIMGASAFYNRIIVLSRRPLEIPNPKIEVVVTEADALALHSEMLIADDVFCCLGTTIKKAGTKEAFLKIDFDYPLLLASICRKNGAKRFFVISSIGANDKSKVFYTGVKGRLESELKKLDFKALHIFRPSLLLGKRNEFRFGEYLGTVLFKVFSCLFVGKFKKYRGIEAEKVAMAMYRKALQDKDGVWVYESDEIAACAI